MKKIERFFINFDKVSHFVPILSSIASVVNFFEKAFMYIFKIDKPKSHYFAHIKNQPNWVTVVCFFPIIGNAAYIIYKCKSKPDDSLQEGQENPTPVQENSNIAINDQLVKGQDPNPVIEEDLNDQIIENVNELSVDNPIKSEPLSIPQLQEKLLDFLQNKKLEPAKRRKNFFKIFDNLSGETKKELLTLGFLNDCYLKYEENNQETSLLVVPNLLKETEDEVVKEFLENKFSLVNFNTLPALIECFKSSPKKILELLLTDEKIYSKFKTPVTVSKFFPYISIKTAISLASEFYREPLDILIKNLSPVLQNQLVDVDFLDEKITYKGEDNNDWLNYINENHPHFAKLLNYANSEKNIEFFNRILQRATDEKTKTIRAIELVLPHLNKETVKDLFLDNTFLSLLAKSKEGKDLIIQYADDETLENWVGEEEFEEHAKTFILTNTPKRILKYFKPNEKEVKFLRKAILECVDVNNLRYDNNYGNRKEDAFKKTAQILIKNFWSNLSPEKKEEIIDLDFLKNCFMEEKNTCNYPGVLLPAILKDASILEIKKFTEFLASEKVSLGLLLDTLLKSLPQEKCKIIDSDLFEKIKDFYEIPTPITASSITLFIPYATDEFKREKAEEILKSEKYDQDMVRFFAALDKDMQKEFVDAAWLEKYFTPEKLKFLAHLMKGTKKIERGMISVLHFASPEQIIKFFDQTLHTGVAKKLIESLPFLLPELDEEVREYIFQQEEVVAELAQNHPALFLKFANDEVVDKWISVEKQKEWSPHVLTEMKLQRAQKYLEPDNLEQARAWIQINPNNLQFFNKEVALVLLEEDVNWFSYVSEELKKDEECLELSFKSLLKQERIETSQNEIKLWIRYDLLEKNPLIVLDLFTKINAPFPNKIDVHFLYPNGKEMQGVDQGGLSRNLFSKFIPALASTLFGEEAKTLGREAYATLGTLLAIAYNKKYPVGPAFLKYFYKLLTALRDSKESRILKAYRKLHTETEKNIEIEVINQIMDIEHLIEENKKLLNKPEIQENMDWDDIGVESDLDKYIQQRFLFVQYLRILFSKQPNLTPDWWDSETIEEDKFLYDHGEKIAQSIKLNEVQSILNELKKEAVEEIKKSEFADLATAFFESIPSKPNTENLIAQLEGTQVSSEILKVLFKIENPTLKQWAEQWLDENKENPKQLEDFLWATTSSRSIILFDPQPSVQFIIGKAAHVTFSSCHNLCKINEDLVKDYETFKEKLSETIEMVLKDPFSMG